MKKNIGKLHYITHTIAEAGHETLAEQACLGGAKWIQLRMKGAPLELIEETALRVKEICRKYGAILIINDHPEIAKSVGADGVHLGKEDMPPDEARKILGGNFIIGGTANTFEDIIRLAEAGVDYIGLGPFRFTETKKKLSPILGEKGYLEIVQNCEFHHIRIPIIAIGGIRAADVPGIIETGVYGVAVSSAITNAPERSAAAKELINEIMKYQ